MMEKKNIKMIPAFLMLFAGAITSIITYVLHYELKIALIVLLMVLIVFYIIGSFIKGMLEKFEAANEAKAKAEAEAAAAEEEGKVVERKNMVHTSTNEETTSEGRRPELDNQSREEGNNEG